MNDAFNHPQSVLVLGGSSEIAGALVDRLVADGCRTVVLAGRDPEALEAAATRARDHGAGTVRIVEFDALDVVHTEAAIGACFDAMGESVDLVLVTLGLLGDAATDVREATESRTTSPSTSCGRLLLSGPLPNAYGIRATGESWFSRLSPGSESVRPTSSTGLRSRAWMDTRRDWPKPSVDLACDSR